MDPEVDQGPTTAEMGIEEPGLAGPVDVVESGAYPARSADLGQALAQPADSVQVAVGVVDEEQPTNLPGEVDRGLRLSPCQGERLLDQNVLARHQGCPR